MIRVLITKALVVGGNTNNGARLNFFENVMKHLLRMEVKICALPFNEIV